MTGFAGAYQLGGRYRGEQHATDRFAVTWTGGIDPQGPAAVFSASDRSTLELALRSRGRKSHRPRQRSFAGGKHRRDQILAERLLPTAPYSHWRPYPVSRVAPKRPDGEPSLFVFRFYEAAVHELTDPATRSHS